MKSVVLPLAFCAALGGCAAYVPYDYPYYSGAYYPAGTAVPYYAPYGYAYPYRYAYPYAYPYAYSYAYPYPYAYPYAYPYYGYGYYPSVSFGISGAWLWGGGHRHGGAHGGHGGRGGHWHGGGSGGRTAGGGGGGGRNTR
jgi:uncharacterized membrane protein YgcG